MSMDLVTRIARQLARPDHAFQRRVLEAAAQTPALVVRWPSPGGHGPPAVNVWHDDGVYRHVDRSVAVLRREELLQLLDAPTGAVAQPWAPTSLGRAVLAALAGQPYTWEPGQSDQDTPPSRAPGGGS